MLKIWLKLVLKGRCARKSRSCLKGCLVFATRTMSDYWSQFEAFQKKSLFFLFFAARTWVLRAS